MRRSILLVLVWRAGWVLEGNLYNVYVT
eukprot:COSAG01_NODE_382_length_17840_cov_68.658663_26_plen_27_part_01